MALSRLDNLELEQDITEALAFNPRIDNSAISVRVQDGVVTLSGTVQNLSQVWEAEESIKSVRDVRGIANNLAVELPGTHRRTDTDIAQAIEHRFATDIYIPDTIKFVVRNGNVTLSGEALTYHEQEEAIAVVRRVVGVRSVNHHITIKNPVRVHADDVKRRIHSWFERAAEKGAELIDVSVNRASVTLTGRVRTIYEREKALEAAWNTPGVSIVVDRLSVIP